MQSTLTKSGRPRLPWGYGQITEIKQGNLRNPFRVMIRLGKDERGKPIVRLLQPQAYFPTYEAAYAALVLYHQRPYDPTRFITVEELFALWLPTYLKKVKCPQHTLRAWKYCSSVYQLKAVNLRARHIKYCLEYGRPPAAAGQHTPSANMKCRIKALFNLMLDYALEFEFVEKNYARTFQLSPELIAETKTARQEHIAYTPEELARLWENVDDLPGVDILLIQCYGGWRPQELGLIELANVDLERWTIIGGMKTAAGKARLVPIHPRIRPLVAAQYARARALGSSYLINCQKRAKGRENPFLDYSYYRRLLLNITAVLGLNSSHRPHDGRTTFITAAKRAGVDEYAIKYMVGHRISDVTERVYTRRETQWLAEELARIP